MKKFLFAALMAGASYGANAAETDSITVAGGCFWCVESDFEAVEGVTGAVSGYTGGHLENPGYKDVTRGGTGHFEAVEITYDPEKVSRRELYDDFFRSIDPTDPGGQFCDRGDSYRTAIFVDADERADAEAAKLDAEKTLGMEIVTPILDKGEFYNAEDYHQDYYIKNPTKYKFYRFSCGRDKRVEALWGDMALKH